VAGSLADSVEALEAVATPRLCHLASWDLVGLVVGIVAGTRASTVVAAAVVSEGALEDVEEDSEAATPDPVAIEMVSALPAALPQDLVDLIEEMAATAISLVGLNPEVDAHMTTDPEMVDETAAEMVVMEAEMEAAMDATEADIGIVTAAVGPAATWNLSADERVGIATGTTTDPVKRITESADTMEVAMRTLANCGGTKNHHQNIRWVLGSPVPLLLSSSVPSSPQQKGNQKVVQATTTNGSEVDLSWKTAPRLKHTRLKKRLSELHFRQHHLDSFLLSSYQTACALIDGLPLLLLFDAHATDEIYLNNTSVMEPERKVIS
jgi:hypothetical protein